MPENKTKPTKRSVAQYIKALPEEQQADARALLRIFEATTEAKPTLWGNMVGFGSYHYKYESGREGDFFATGFALRKSGPTIYIMPGYEDYGELLAKLGPHKLGKSCLYLKRLSDVDERVLMRLIRAGLRDLRKRYPVSLE